MSSILHAANRAAAAASCSRSEKDRISERHTHDEADIFRLSKTELEVIYHRGIVSSHWSDPVR